MKIGFSSVKTQGASFILMNGKPVVRFSCLLSTTSQCSLVTLLKTEGGFSYPFIDFRL